MLDVRVSNLAGKEIMPDVRGNALLVDVERNVSQVAGKARQSYRHRDGAYREQREAPCSRADHVAPPSGASDAQGNCQ